MPFFKLFYSENKQTENRVKLKIVVCLTRLKNLRNLKICKTIELKIGVTTDKIVSPLICGKTLLRGTFANVLKHLKS